MERFKDYYALIIDDDKYSLEGMIEYLQIGFGTVFSASSINEAREIIKKNRIDIIFSDIRMPDGNGFLLIEWLKEEGLEIPVVLVSAYDDKDELFRAIKLGVVDYIVKPLDSQKLNSTLDLCYQRLKNKENIIRLVDGFYWDADNNILFKDNHSIKLTSNEMKFFELLLQNPGRAIATEEIFYYIYNNDHIEYDSKNIRNLIYKLRKKVGKELIENIYGGKYRINIEK